MYGSKFKITKEIIKETNYIPIVTHLGTFDSVLFDNTENKLKEIFKLTEYMFIKEV